MHTRYDKHSTAAQKKEKIKQTNRKKKQQQHTYTQMKNTLKVRVITSRYFPQVIPAQVYFYWNRLGSLGCINCLAEWENWPHFFPKIQLKFLLYNSRRKLNRIFNLHFFKLT